MRIILKKEIIIPKGTVFENIDYSTTKFYEDNYDTYIELNKDTTARIIITSENKEYFEVEDV